MLNPKHLNDKFFFQLNSVNQGGPDHLTPGGTNSENIQNSRGGLNFTLRFFPTKFSRGATPPPPPSGHPWC
jgi:hypothetical protein